MKFLAISFFVLGASAFTLYQPDGREKETYEIMELVLRKEGATKIYQQACNERFLASTDSLKKLYELTGDSSFRLGERKRVQLVEQAKASASTKWDKHKVYHYTIVEKDKVADVSASVMDFKISPEYRSENGKTLSIHRISVPLFKSESEAIVYVEFGMIGILNNEINFNEGHQKVYLVRKHNTKWSVVKGVLIGGN